MQKGQKKNQGVHANLCALPAMPATPSLEHGRVAVVQSDSRMCEPPSNTTASHNYWWVTAQINARWAEAHGYDHLTYCYERCLRAPDVDVSAAWCKLLALRDALRWNRWDTLLYLDSDAFWNAPSGIAALDAYIGAADEPERAGVLFGCNLPYASEDRGRVRWGKSWLNGERGPANTGVMIIRNVAAAHYALSAWWNATYEMPHWNTRFAWEQSALWALWKHPAFAAPLRVLSNLSAQGPPDRTGTIYEGDCMRTMDRSRPSPIVHLPSGGTGNQHGGAHASDFEQALSRSTSMGAKGWRTWFVRLAGNDRSLTRCARILHVGPHAAQWMHHNCSS